MPPSMIVFCQHSFNIRCRLRFQIILNHLSKVMWFYSNINTTNDPSNFYLFYKSQEISLFKRCLIKVWISSNDNMFKILICLLATTHLISFYNGQARPGLLDMTSNCSICNDFYDQCINIIITFRKISCHQVLI